MHVSNASTAWERDTSTYCIHFRAIAHISFTCSTFFSVPQKVSMERTTGVKRTGKTPACHPYDGGPVLAEGRDAFADQPSVGQALMFCMPHRRSWAKQIWKEGVESSESSPEIAEVTSVCRHRLEGIRVFIKVDCICYYRRKCRLFP